MISAKDPAQNNVYVGNVIVGVDTTKTEVIRYMSSVGETLIQQVNEEGDRQIQNISGLLAKYKAMSGILEELFAAFMEEYGEAGEGGANG